MRREGSARRPLRGLNDQAGIDLRFNASTGRVGLRQRSYLILGMPLWTVPRTPPTPYAIVARISSTIARVVPGCRKAKRATVSPSQPVGVTKAIWSASRRSDQAW